MNYKKDTRIPAVIQIEKRFKRKNLHLLWMLMEFPIIRYLLSNTRGRLNGMEKAEQHINLCAIFIASYKQCSIDKARTDEDWIKIHEATQKLTGYLDTEIGFPVNEESCEIDYDKLAKKFFKRFIALAENCFSQEN